MSSLALLLRELTKGASLLFRAAILDIKRHGVFVLLSHCGSNLVSVHENLRKPRLVETLAEV